MSTAELQTYSKYLLIIQDSAREPVNEGGCRTKDVHG